MEKQHEQNRYDDFTESNYESILCEAKNYYRFISFKDALEYDFPVILWRHDVDFSVHRAFALAKIEKDLEILSTYFIHLHSSFYNALENSVVNKIREIIALGHSIGLHFDPTAFSGRVENWTEIIALEKAILENYFEVRIEAVSWHNPELCGWLSTDEHEICGMINAYSKQIRERFAYSSDSNGYWRFEPLQSVIKSRKHEKLQVLTHPCWWTKEPMSPKKRVLRCAEGRAHAIIKEYDRLLEESGRLNIDD
ncbi:MAG: hypothetical protein FWH52_01160 [Synergistaceae bacterium]|nr:hypothetical protein [Synergistaceae bacterium]